MTRSIAPAAPPSRGSSAFDRAVKVADAVLYEGYLLYPYRKSSGKNQMRFQFGVLAPPAWVEANVPPDDSVAGSIEAAQQQTECLFAAPTDASLQVRLRFLQLQVKTLERRVGGTFEPVDALRVDGDLHVPFEEAVPHEYDMVLSVSALGAEELVPGAVAGGEEVDPLYDASGRLVGRVRRQRWPITFVVQLRADDLGNDLPVRRLRVRTVNTYASCVAGAPRSVALRHAMLSTHTLLALTEGAFVSLLDPPSWAAEPVRSCRNRHTFPVLMGSAEDCDLMLSAPILLYDHVQVAPESAGDLHDATEIDEILSLRTLTLTDAEKAEARATDARAAAIVDRVDAMTPADWGRLHGTIRTETAAPGAAPWWDPGSDTSVSPETDRVVVGGVPVRKGSRVRLHPRPRGTDVHDMFLDGRTAYVEAVLIDVDDTRHLAVTVDDDPAAELNRWYGRFRYFSADEVEPLMDSEGRQP